MFKREQRYLVLKLTDIYGALTDTEIGTLTTLSSTVANYRKRAGKNPLHTVVVEREWPEYNTVWKMLEERVNAA